MFFVVGHSIADANSGKPNEVIFCSVLFVCFVFLSVILVHCLILLTDSLTVLALIDTSSGASTPVPVSERII